MKEAVGWALSQLSEQESPYEFGFVDLVRQYFIDNGIEYPPMTFEDVKPYLPK